MNDLEKLYFERDWEAYEAGWLELDWPKSLPTRLRHVLMNTGFVSEAKLREKVESGFMHPDRCKFRGYGMKCYSDLLKHFGFATEPQPAGLPGHCTKCGILCQHCLNQATSA